IWLLVAPLRVARIPCDLQRRLRNRGKEATGLGAGCGVAGVLVLEDEREAALACLDRGRAHDLVDRGAMRPLVVEPPEIEDPYAVGLKGFGKLKRAIEQLLLLVEREAGAELVARRAERRLRRTRPVDLEDRRGDARHTQVEALEDAADIGDLRRIPVHDVLA